jgi:hypothetical protein
MTIFAEAMPNMLRHAGFWEGTYRHVDRDFTLIDEHHMWTHCEFPVSGDYAYIQHNKLSWADGRTVEYKFGGVFRDGLLHWDTDRFKGYGWETIDGTVMLTLDRLDDPGCHYVEMINLSADGNTRARTWQWYQRGVPTKRTLCDEYRVG